MAKGRAALSSGPPACGFSPYVLGLRETLRRRKTVGIAKLKVGGLSVDIRQSRDSVWALIRRHGNGGLSLRLAYFADQFRCRFRQMGSGHPARLTIDSILGKHVVEVETGDGGLERLRATVRFTPSAPMLVPFMPRDLYPLDGHDDPLGAAGNVEAAQRGLNGGLLYFHLDTPAFGSVLYFQNLTAMNGYYRATKTKPDGAVGGEWPELGFLLPTPVQSGTPPTNPLPAGVEVIISDAILVFQHGAPSDERDSARRFMQMLGTAYAGLDPPRTEYRDWIDRAEKTLRDLDKAPEAGMVGSPISRQLSRSWSWERHSRPMRSIFRSPPARNCWPSWRVSCPTMTGRSRGLLLLCFMPSLRVH